jgi:hypothetical protein
MDEKGFMIGIAGRSKRVFSKLLWEQKKVTAALQDGNREWVSILACICADGSAIDPAIIFEAKGPLRGAWLRDVDARKHRVFFTITPSGWSNDDVGLAWLEQVFERCTKKKARSSYRILILDGHASHLTTEFIEYCDSKRIFLMVFPAHATHTLQPLDVALFSPLSTAYTVQLTQHLHRNQGLIGVEKGEFFPVIWAAYESSFTAKNIQAAFRATGVEPRDADVILRRFKTSTPLQDENTENI